MSSQAPFLLSEYANSTSHYFTFSLMIVIELQFKNILNNHFLLDFISYLDAHPSRLHSLLHYVPLTVSKYCFEFTFWISITLVFLICNVLCFYLRLIKHFISHLHCSCFYLVKYFEEALALNTSFFCCFNFYFQIKAY